MYRLGQPGERRKVAFINFWATCCTPCIQRLPQTVVLNRRGEAGNNKVGSVTPELLEALYEEAPK